MVTELRNGAMSGNVLKMNIPSMRLHCHIKRCSHRSDDRKLSILLPCRRDGQHQKLIRNLPLPPCRICQLRSPSAARPNDTAVDLGLGLRAERPEPWSLGAKSQPILLRHFSEFLFYLSEIKLEVCLFNLK